MLMKTKEKWELNGQQAYCRCRSDNQIRKEKRLLEERAKDLEN